MSGARVAWNAQSACLKPFFAKLLDEPMINATWKNSSKKKLALQNKKWRVMQNYKPKLTAHGQDCWSLCDKRARQLQINVHYIYSLEVNLNNRCKMHVLEKRLSKCWIEFFAFLTKQRVSFVALLLFKELKYWYLYVFANYHRTGAQLPSLLRRGSCVNKDKLEEQLPVTI